MLQSQAGWRFPKLWRSSTGKGVRSQTDNNNAIRKQLQSEKLWPSTLDHEAYKAALILRSFCQDGLLRDPALARRASSQDLLRIPPEIIRKAKGLIICSIMRAGLWESGAGGSGVAIARLEDDTWSCPAAIQVQTAEIGVIVGVDIFDCVLVLNTAKSVESIKNGRCFIGGDLYAVSGPFNISWFLESDARSRTAPVFSYLRSQRYHADTTLDNSTFINERLQENEDFYSPQKLAAADILAGKVRAPPLTLSSFRETLIAAQGDATFDQSLVPTGPPPSDFSVVNENHSFGLPDVDDPDPFGALALEKHGFALRDAQTKRTAAPEVFDFNPSLTSPLHERYHRKTNDASSIGGRSSWRASSLGAVDKYDDRASTLSIRTGPESPTASSPLASPDFKRMESDGPHIVSMSVHGNNDHSPEPVENVRLSRQSMPDRLEAVHEEDTTEIETNGANDREVSSSEQIINREIEVEGLPNALHETAVDAAVHTANGSEQSGANGDTVADADKKDYEDESSQAASEAEETDSDHFEDPDEEFEVFDGNQPQASAVAFGAAATLSISKPKVVEVKPVPAAPTLPTRNPVRLSAIPANPSSPPSIADPADIGHDFKSLPLRDSAKDNHDPVSPIVSAEENEDQTVMTVSPVRSLHERSILQEEKCLTLPAAPTLLDMHNIRSGLRGSPSPEMSPDRSPGASPTYFK